MKKARVGPLLYSCVKDDIGLVGKVVIAGIIARMTEIASFLLPIQAFMISARKKIPKFLPEILSQYDYRVVILVLAILAIVCYVVSDILNKYMEGKAGGVAISSLVSTMKSEGGSDGIVDKIAHRVFSTYVEIFFMTTVIVIFLVLSPILLLSLLPYYVIAFIFISKKIDSFIDNIDDGSSKGDEYDFSYLVDIGFAVGLVTALILSFYANNKEMLYLFVCFILMRRTKGSIRKLIKNYAFLKNKLIRL